MLAATRFPEARRKAPRVLLAVLCAAVVVCLSQCKLAPDAVTGLNRSENSQSRSASSPGSCISDCAHQANDAMKLEQDLHKDNVEACNSDPTCLANEEARHEAAVDAIQNGRKACMSNCHHQGGGKGGR